MRRADFSQLAIILVVSALLTACDQSGARSAAGWIAEQEKIVRPGSLPPVPDVIDTPPAQFTSKAFDPFSPERISARYKASVLSGQPGVLFPDASLSALTIVGFMTGKDGATIAIIRNGPEYRTVRKGNRISEEALQIKEIGNQSLIVGGDGIPDQRVERTK